MSGDVPAGRANADRAGIVHIEQHESIGRTTPADLTARARIRDAALRRFADHGAQVTTIREVANAAGVTPGLVCHHYGSKRGLRAACDAYVLEYLQETNSEAGNERKRPDPEHFASVYRSDPVVLRYLARALLDGSAAAAALFDDLVLLTEENLKDHEPPQGMPQTNPRALAAVQVAMLLGTWVFHDHMLRALDADASTPQISSRVTAALADIMSSDFVGWNLLRRSRRNIR